MREIYRVFKLSLIVAIGVAVSLLSAGSGNKYGLGLVAPATATHIGPSFVLAGPCPAARNRERYESRLSPPFVTP